MCLEKGNNNMGKRKTQKSNTLPHINQSNIHEYLYEIRGVKVMLSSDLAEAYGYEVKAFNRQVNNNKERFPPGFRFKLTKEELHGVLRCKNCTINKTPQRGEHYKYMPYVYTEYGVLMLGNVLKGPIAVAQSIEMVIAFKVLKDKYLGEDVFFLPAYQEIGRRVDNNAKSIKELEDRTIKIETKTDYIENALSTIVDTFSDQKSFDHCLILDGQRVESDIAYQKIYRLAKKSIYLVDDYIGLKTLVLLKCCGENIVIKIFSDNVNKMPTIFIDDFVSDTGNKVELFPTNNKFHDRFILIDYGTNNEQIFICGSSSKDGGNKISTITKVNDVDEYRELFDELLKSIQ